MRIAFTAMGTAATLLLTGCAVLSTQLTWFAAGQTYAGEAHNYTGASVLSHDIDVQWLDASGNVLRTDHVQGCLRSLAPGNSDFFEATAPPDLDWAGVRAVLSPRLSFGEAPESGLLIRETSADRVGATLNVSVRLDLTDADFLSSPRACVVVRNAAGNVIRVATAELPPLTGSPQTAHLSVSVPYTGRLTVEVWADALLHGSPALPVSSPPIVVDTPAAPTGISALDPILRVLGAGPEDAIRPYLAYQVYTCRPNVTPPGGDPCRPEEAGRIIPVFSVGGCEGAFVRAAQIGFVLETLASPQLQLYGVYHASRRGEDYVAVYAAARPFLGIPSSDYSAAVHITGDRISWLEYSCATSDPAQLAREAGAPILPPPPLAP
jgi:hypothetical protein